MVARVFGFVAKAFLEDSGFCLGVFGVCKGFLCVAVFFFVFFWYC